MAHEPPARPVGHRLVALQRIYGLTQTQLAKRLGSTQSFLSHVARGNRPMPELLALKASSEFGLPVSFFYVQQSAAEATPATFRKNSQATVREGERVVALYDEAARVFRTISEASGYRTAELPDPSDYNGEPELVAEEMRAHAGLGWNEPVLNATRALERFGVGVVDNLDHLSTDAWGHTAVSRPSRVNLRPLVALVAEVPGAVKRLTMLHEVGHLIFDRDLAAPISGVRSPEERRAYKFAGAYLLPQRVMRERVSETLNLQGYLPIKADYGISVSAIVTRAHELGVISPERARSLHIQISSQGWRWNEPVPVADEKPLLLAQALRRVYAKQTMARAAHVLGVAPDWLQRWTHAHTEPPGPELGKVIDLTQRLHIA